MNSFVGQMKNDLFSNYHNCIVAYHNISMVLKVAKNLCKSMTASSILITILLLYTYVILLPFL